MAETYADQRAHDVALMTAAEREAYGERLATIDDTVARGPAAGLVDAWQAARAELAAAERAGHPDIADRFGRAWSWRSGQLYVHDSFAWTAGMIARCESLPPAALAANPNYRLCAACTAEWPVTA